MMGHSKQHWVDHFARENGGSLLRFLRSLLNNEGDTEELAQEVYLRLLRLDDPGQVRNPRAYALRIAANIVHEWRLLKRNSNEHSSQWLEDLSSSADPLRETDCKQQLQLLNQALLTLSPKCRAVLLLHRRDNLTYSEIASHLGLSVAMVKKYLAQGLAVCQKHVAGKMITKTSTTRDGAK